MMYHLCLDVCGFLMHNTRKRDYVGLFYHDDGRLMSADEAKRELLTQLSMGRKVIPTCECSNFDYQKGCLGHPDRVTVPAAERDIPLNTPEGQRMLGARDVIAEEAFAEEREWRS